MDMIVCVKHVPETAEEDITISDNGKRNRNGRSCIRY